MRTRLPRAERERQMLETAHALFAERGYAEVTMDEVAAAVGVTKPLLYNYFGNKERLYAACMAPAAEALADAIVAAVRSSGTPAEALSSAIHAFFAFLDADREGWRVLFDETLPERVAAYRERLAELVMAELDAAVEPLTVAVLGAAEALGRWWLRTEAMPAATAADLLIRTLEPGLRTS
jgi:AcrR family transcriptional regulator